MAPHGDRIDIGRVDVLSMKWTCPSNRNPRTRSFIRFRDRRTVLFPQPDGPMKAVIDPFSMGILVSRTALNVP